MCVCVWGGGRRRREGEWESGKNGGEWERECHVDLDSYSSCNVARLDYKTKRLLAV